MNLAFTSGTVADAFSLAVGHLSRRAVVVVDVVESVLHMRRDEQGFVLRWSSFLDAADREVLPRFGGRMVKSYGDGLLGDMPDATQATAAAFALHDLIARDNDGRDARSAIQLRAGVHVCGVFVDRFDIYGAGVNLAARITALAAPGGVALTVEARGDVTDGVEFAVEDLGERYLKHYDEPVRVYSAMRAGTRTAPRRAAPALAWKPVIVVLPPVCLIPPDGDLSRGLVLSEALADDIGCALSGCQELSVTSRLSTQAFAGKAPNFALLQQTLGAAYVVHGRFRAAAGQFQCTFELCDARSGEVLWADTQSSTVTAVLAGEHALAATVAENIGRQVLRTELQRARTLPFSSLSSYTLHLAAVAMLHRLARKEFEISRELLETLADRHPRNPEPLAQLAKWHVLQMVQGWSVDPQQSAVAASATSLRALDLDPTHGLALAMHAVAIGHLTRDLSAALQVTETATSSNPQELHAWLTTSSILSYLGEGPRAEVMAERGLQLSPLDPARCFIDVFLSAAQLTAGKFDDAVASAKAAIRRNALHPPAHRLLTMALAMAGRTDEARSAAHRLLSLCPEFSVSGYASLYPGRDRPHLELHLAALEAAGVPR